MEGDSFGGLRADGSVILKWVLHMMGQCELGALALEVVSDGLLWIW